MDDLSQVVQRIWCLNSEYQRLRPLFLLADSDIIHLNVVGTSMVVLDTSEAANELLERRSLIYSDRYRLVTAVSYKYYSCS